jgi:AcrR family transcriptional regulator
MVTKQKKKEEKRKIILEAAGECFAQFGYKKTTLEDIGEKVGLNKASLYYYFESKEEIFIKLTANHFRVHNEKLFNEIEGKGPCSKKILTLFEKKHEWWYQQSQLLPQITKDDVTKFIEIGRGEVAKLKEDEKKKFSEFLRKCIDLGQIKDCDTTAVSKYFYALVDGIMATYRTVDTMRPVAVEESSNILNDTLIALKIFIKGLE